MAAPANIISYLRECYRCDNRENQILNVFDSKIEYQSFVEKPDSFWNGLLPYISQAHKQLPEIAKQAEFQKREKTLYLTAFLITGIVNQEEECQKICSPLWMGPAEIRLDGITPAISAKSDWMQVNYPLLNLLKGLQDQEFNLEKLAAELPGFPLNENKILQLAQVLGKYFPYLDLSEMVTYPEQYSEKEVKKKLRKKDCLVSLSVIPATTLIFVKQSTETRGILAELELISQKKDLSAPIRFLLGEKKNRIQSSRSQANLPVILSPHQKQALANAAQHDFSLIIGPPGTGKSFTIASIAVDHLSRGETVLIAAKTNQAVDVVGDKIEDILGVRNFSIRGGRKKYLKDLKFFINNLLNGIFPFPDMSLDVFKSKQQQQIQIESQVKKLETLLKKRSRDEEQWGEWTINPSGNFFQKTWKGFQNSRLGQKLKNARPYWELSASYQHLWKQYLDLTRELLQKKIRNQIEQTIQNKRKELKIFLKAISSLHYSNQEIWFAQTDFQEIFKAFPVWLVNLSDISQVLPLVSELFDVVILDESTQCDIASSIPVLYSARRAVVVGDPHQLRHVSFLSRERQKTIARDEEISKEDSEIYNYRDISLLDLVQDRIQDQTHIVLLDEYFRGLAPLIQFSNREFYGNCLKIMKGWPQSQRGEKCLSSIYVKGHRHADGFNVGEAEKISNKVKALIDEQKSWPDHQYQRQSIGILSPFSAQVDYISKKLSQELLQSDIEHHQLLIGTPYAFQGEERDILLISLCLDEDAHPSAFFYLNRPDVLNVSITRAKKLQKIYYSFSLSNPKVKGLIRKYLEFIKNQEESETLPAEPGQDSFLAEVRNALQMKNWRCWTFFPIGGFYIDLVIEKNKNIAGIDLVGFPGIYFSALDLGKYQVFQRAQLSVFPLSLFAWRNNPEKCLQAIESQILGIGISVAKNSTDALPTAPILKFPSPKQSVNTSRPTFEWNEVFSYPAVESYQIQISNAIGQLFYDNENINQLVFIPDQDFKNNISIKWKVRASNANGYGNWSETRSFQCIDTISPAPKLVSPHHQATLETLTPAFGWDELYFSPTIEYYHLQIFQGNQEIYNNKKIEATYDTNKAGIDSIPTGILQKGQEYSWRVRAKNRVGWSEWSQPFNFKIKP